MVEKRRKKQKRKSKQIADIADERLIFNQVYILWNFLKIK